MTFTLLGKKYFMCTSSAQYIIITLYTYIKEFYFQYGHRQKAWGDQPRSRSRTPVPHRSHNYLCINFRQHFIMLFHSQLTINTMSLLE